MWEEETLTCVSKDSQPKPTVSLGTVTSTETLYSTTEKMKQDKCQQSTLDPVT